ncbi:GNAT family N-acetyltransferase [Compostimonas suwonensis]|uniref:N-acetyltransferase domain-containing protein n=1 Tax=Compostimonas suwonensis TaxID=1048394 RepID=A0A2M9BTV5_9MICO|nr:GNAT family N-acetyltransferase [Compostimonas suwonensis]PJJ61373.1 hypothetical protein CLV54_2317 [Compostimonas suwonensis]
MSDVEIRDNSTLHRFEATLDGEIVGRAYYRPVKGGLIFTHTEVDPAAEGTGVGSALAKTALTSLRETGSGAVLQCPFFRSYVSKHPEFEDVVMPMPAGPAE